MKSVNYLEMVSLLLHKINDLERKLDEIKNNKYIYINMPNKKKFGKNSKLKRKMKGGNVPIDAGSEVVNKPIPTPLQSKPISRSVEGGKSSYAKLSDNVYVSVIMAIGLMGVLWFMISRSMIKHKYSEVLSYSLLAVGVFFSLSLIIFKGVRQIKPSDGIIGAIKNMLFVTKYLAVRSVPGLLILLQLAVLCYIMYNHADYIFTSENIPKMFGVFNAITIVMILGQCWVWKDKVKEIMSNIKAPTNPMILPGFILASILSGISISQLYIILEYLRTDC